MSTVRCANCGRGHDLHCAVHLVPCCPGMCPGAGSLQVASEAWQPDAGGWEVIGPPECPILLRRTLVARKRWKLLLHRFMPGAADRDPHDHPRPFLTLVLRGGYDDVQPCRACKEGTVTAPAGGVVRCRVCRGERQAIDRVRAVTVRYRPATHVHTTLVHADGATTLVLMGPLVRAWGFFRDGRWWPWREYDEAYGHGSFRCPE